MNIPKERQVKSTKLAPHAEEDYLVGFEGSKIYRIYLPGRAQKIVRTSHCIFDKSEPLAPENPNNPENDSTQADGIKYTSQGEDGGLDQEYNPLTTIIVDTADQEDSNTSPLPISRGRGRSKGSKNKQRALEPPTIQLGSETPSQTGLPDQIDQEETSQESIEAP